MIAQVSTLIFQKCLSGELESLVFESRFCQVYHHHHQLPLHLFETLTDGIQWVSRQIVGHVEINLGGTAMPQHLVFSSRQMVYLFIWIRSSFIFQPSLLLPPLDRCREGVKKPVLTPVKGALHPLLLWIKSGLLWLSFSWRGLPWCSVLGSPLLFLPKAHWPHFFSSLIMGRTPYSCPS